MAFINGQLLNEIYSIIRLMSKKRYRRQRKQGLSSERYTAFLFLFTLFIITSFVTAILGLQKLLQLQQREMLPFFAFSFLSGITAIWVRRYSTELQIMTESEVIDEDLSVIYQLRLRLLWGGVLFALPAILLLIGVAYNPKALDSIIAWIIVISAIISTGSITCAFKIYQFKRKSILYGYLFSLLYLFNPPFGPILAVMTFRQTRKVSYLFRN